MDLKRLERIYEYLLLLNYFLIGIKAACSNTYWIPPSGGSYGIQVFDPASYVIYFCSLGNYFYPDRTIYFVAQCSGTNSWPSSSTIQNCNPVVFNTPPAPTCTSNPTPPSFATLRTIFAYKLNANIQVYECSNGTSWLSGEQFRISQCNGTTWTPIYDICDTDCSVPRQCSDISKLGLQTDGYYNVIGSGDKQFGTGSQVLCQLNSTNPAFRGGGWTLILNRKNGVAFPSSPCTGSSGCNATNYIWSGTQYLSDISQDLDGNIQGNVLEVNLIYSGNMYYTAVYGNFAVGAASDYQLISLGTYHGNAGDAMSPLLNTKFDTTNLWWGFTSVVNKQNISDSGGSFLTNYYSFWAPINPSTSDAANLQTIQMRIRAIDFDQGIACPPLVGSFPSWITTSAYISPNRAVGATITWACNGDNLYEGEEGSQRTTSGSATCLKNSNNSLSWSNSVTLPCSYVCPANYTMSRNGSACYYSSTVMANSFVDAQLQCQLMNASLAVMQGSYDASFANDPTLEYLVSNNNRSTVTPGYTPATNGNLMCQGSGLVCQGNCGNDPINLCMSVKKNGTYQYVSCNKPAFYMCQLPVDCSKYVKSPMTPYASMGGCYLPINGSNIQNLYETCRNYGFDLAYPTTSAQMDSLVTETRKYLTRTPGGMSLSDPFGIGLNYVNQNWSHGNYLMGNLASTAPLHTSTPYWESVSIASNSYGFTQQSINSTLKQGICHVNGQRDCSEGPPLSLNGMTRPLNVSLDYGSIVTYNCTPGSYIVGGSSGSYQNQINVTCLGQIGGWYDLTTITNCAKIEVCRNTTLSIPTELIKVENPDSYYFNGTILFSCPFGTVTTNNITNQTITCSQTGYMIFAFQPQPDSCSRCIGSLLADNTTTNSWTDFYPKTSSVQVKCIANYQYAYNITSQIALCTDNGWNYTYTSGCHLACTGAPPTAQNMTSNFQNINEIGTILTYTCDAGLEFVTNKDFRNVTNVATVVCDKTGKWVNPRENGSFVCMDICEANPPSNPLNATNNWNNYSRSINDTVTYTCDDGFLFSGYLHNLTLRCNGSNWIDYNKTTFACMKACNAPTPLLLNATTNYSAPAAFVNQTALYTCLDGLGNQTHKTTNFSINCTNKGWTNATYFLCEKICFTDPPPAPRYATSNYANNTKEGIVITYNCPYGHFENQTDSALKIQQSSCIGGNWSLPEIPQCLTITTPGPTTIPPVVLPETSNALLYASTTTTYFSAIDTFNTTSGIKGDYTLVNSLVGFGYGIQLIKNKSECMIKPQYVPDYKTCEINPNNCAAGLSFSIWALVLYDDSVYDMSSITVDDYQYFASTGADQNGHPGIAMGVAKQWLFALVSTGNQYWYTQILGQLRNNTWNNVGVRWSKSMGMEVYVNATRVGYTNVSKSVNAMPSYSPPMLILGCQKTQSESSYHSYLNGYLDEFAIWPYTVNLTNNQSLLFLGGYTSNITDMSPAEFQAMLQNVVISNPGQQAAAVKILSQLTSQQMLATSSPPTASQASATGASPSASADSPAPTTPPPGNVQGLQSIGNILMQLLDPTRTPVTLTPDAASSMLKVSQSLSDVLSSDNTAAWKVIQNQTESVSPIQLAQQFRQYHAKICQAIQYTNVSTPICEEQVYSNLYYKYCKMTISDLGNMGSKVQLPDYTQPSLKSLREMWDDILTDRVAFPTNCFTDIRCSSRPVSFIFHYYGYVDQTAPGTANPVSVPRGSLTAVDSRLMNIDLVVDKAVDANGNPDTSQPLCEVDAELMLANQLTYKAVHIDQVSAQVTPRKILLFENMSVTDVKQRLCVQWNENISDIGAWDSTGCDITVDTDEFSICACTVFGLFSIMAIKSEPIVIPTEPSWVFVLKYILYGVSAISIILYIVVVLYSGDLKDQFHLVGLHLAFAILIGSIAMVLSDFHSVQSDRNSCTIIGTIMHICYGAVGMWMIGLGHASFNGITAGVIGGRLLSYCLLCWGASFAFAGVPFLTMLTQMGYDPRCFIGWDNIVKWVFFAPQMAAAILSMFFALVILCNLSTPALRKENLIRDYSSFCRGAALLIIYLCATWVFGLLAYMRLGIAIDFYPIFQVLNSLSGTCLLFFIGFGSERFRSILAGQAKARHEMLRQHAFGFPEGDEKQKSSSKLPSNTPSTASTANLVPEEPTVPLEEF